MTDQSDVATLPKDETLDPEAQAPGSDVPAPNTEVQDLGPEVEAVAPEASSQLRTLRSRGRWRGTIALLGPAFIAAIAYIDPGNFATNIEGGAVYGYKLVWVVLLANAMAMIVQYLSAKIGIATGHNLSELCRLHMTRRSSIGLWIQAELVAIATDLAEFTGAAIAFNLLFGVPLFIAGVLTAIVSFAILALQRRGYRRFELAIFAFLGIVLFGFAYDLAAVGINGIEIVRGAIPTLGDKRMMMLAVGIVGATVMPHIVYLHSALTQNRIRTVNESERRELLRFQRTDVIIALTIAGAINLSMMVLAAELFFGQGIVAEDWIVQMHTSLGTYVSGTAALAFAVALLASGLSSSSVGTYSGQVVMQGFIRRRIPLFLRRAITMAPALIVLAIGLNPTTTIVLSQVVLSFGIPFALIPLIMLTRNRGIMGNLVNKSWLTITAAVITAIVIVLNALFLIYELLL